MRFWLKLVTFIFYVFKLNILEITVVCIFTTLLKQYNVNYIYAIIIKNILI